jgi:hypothetical protein
MGTADCLRKSFCSAPGSSATPASSHFFTTCCATSFLMPPYIICDMMSRNDIRCMGLRVKEHLWTSLIHWVRPVVSWGGGVVVVVESC